MQPLKRLPAHFYRSDSGREPVREWLKRLQPEDRKIIGEDIKDVEYSWPIGIPRSGKRVGHAKYLVQGRNCSRTGDSARTGVEKGLQTF